MSSTETTPDIADEARAMQHDPEAGRKIANRLRRAHGQLAAVITAVEGGDDCRTIVQQLSAVSKALDRAGFLVISTALRECLTDPGAEGAANPEELEKLFLSLA
ncbi:MAG: metal-sensitive transcriptional regulator [Actinobacteria bacterium]|nr:metal-sensitive transcriptional regulator [Actinomycetota bacterium]